MFAGVVNEPKVAFTTSRIDLSNCMLGGEGGSEIIYIENDDHAGAVQYIASTAGSNMGAAISQS